MSMAVRPRTTLAEVAVAAGVSKATASKALNGRHDVGQATRQRVLQAANELGFSPNSLARGLSGGRTGVVGVIASDLDGRFVLPILRGAEDALGAGEVSVLLCDARGDSVREARHLATLTARRIDGIIVVGDSNEPRPSLVDDLGVPVVYVYAPSERPKDVSLTPDNRLIGELATAHVLTCGRRRIAHISGERQHAAARERAAGFAATLADAGLDPVLPPAFGDWTAAWGRAAAAMALADAPDLDAVVCGSDRIAFGVIETLRAHGRSVPQDVSVVGADNWLPLAEDVKPSLTTVDLGLEQLGRTAARHIFAMLDGEPVPSGTTAAPARLVIRGSSLPTG
jgi:LacI family transcriptional regulator